MLRFTPAAAAGCIALAPAGAFAVDYLSAEQAARLMFVDAEGFEAKVLTLDANALQQLSAAGVPARSAQWQLLTARRAGHALGWVVVDDVIGKFERITYAVGINLDGSVRQVEVLSYRESHGQEIRLPAWRRQFVGKTPHSPLRVGEDIANISGATLSCTHVTDGVRRIVAVMDLARRQNRL